MACRRTSPVKKVRSSLSSCRATLFSWWNWSSRNILRKMSLVRMCWSSISRTSDGETAGPMVRRHRSKKDDAASWYSGLSASASATVARRFSSTVGRSVLNWLWACRNSWISGSS